MQKVKSYLGRIIIQLKAEEELFDDAEWQLQKLKDQRSEHKYSIDVRYKNITGEKEWSLFNPKIKMLDQLIDQKISNGFDNNNSKKILREVNELLWAQNQLISLKHGT